MAASIVIEAIGIRGRAGVLSRRSARDRGRPARGRPSDGRPWSGRVRTNPGIGSEWASPEGKKFAALLLSAPKMVEISGRRAEANRTHRGLHGSRPGQDN